MSSDLLIFGTKRNVVLPHLSARSLYSISHIKSSERCMILNALLDCNTTAISE